MRLNVDHLLIQALQEDITSEDVSTNAVMPSYQYGQVQLICKEEGIIAGGGSAYIHASKKVAELVATLEGDEKTGANVILKALEAPLFHISANAGLEGSVIINKVRESEPGVGFDALNEKYVDMVGAGILDPVKVTRSALQNATSVASTLLTTESVVATIKEDAPAMPAGAPGMGGMM